MHAGGREFAVNSRDEYRRLAAKCLVLAPCMGSQEARSRLIEMARLWSRLADAREPPIPPRTADPSRPVVQQQQQLKANGDASEGPLGALDRRCDSSIVGGFEGSHLVERLVSR
jgi:hypothetical protein